MAGRLIVRAAREISTAEFHPAVPPITHTPLTAMLQDLTLQTFEPLLGAPFGVIVSSDRFLPVHLVGVQPLARDGDSRRKRDPFTLIFRGPAGGHVPQGVYPVQGRDLEEMELFLVPIGPDEHGMLYEAVFT